MQASVNGVELWYDVAGAGEPCLWVSVAGTELYQRTIPPALLERLQVIFVELRGSGRSGGEAASLTFEQAGDDLEALRVQLGLGRVAVWAHSAHTSFAVEYAKRHPASVSRVILIAPPLAYAADATARVEQFWQEDASAERKRLMAESLAALTPEQRSGADTSPAAMRRLIRAYAPRQWYDPAFDPISLLANQSGSPAAYLHAQTALLPGWSAAMEAHRLTMPLFVALGRYDYIVPYTSWDGARDKFPDATVRVFERSAHYPHYEQPETFVAATLAWMDGR